jgi:hypothetical protein
VRKRARGEIFPPNSQRSEPRQHSRNTDSIKQRLEGIDSTSRDKIYITLSAGRGMGVGEKWYFKGGELKGRSYLRRVECG